MADDRDNNAEDEQYLSHVALVTDDELNAERIAAAFNALLATRRRNDHEFDSAMQQYSERIRELAEQVPPPRAARGGRGRGNNARGGGNLRPQASFLQQINENPEHFWARRELHKKARTDPACQDAKTILSEREFITFKTMALEDGLQDEGTPGDEHLEALVEASRDSFQTALAFVPWEKRQNVEHRYGCLSLLRETIQQLVRSAAEPDDLVLVTGIETPFPLPAYLNDKVHFSKVKGLANIFHLAYQSTFGGARKADDASPWATLCREVREETGLDVSQIAGFQAEAQVRARSRAAFKGVPYYAKSEEYFPNGGGSKWVNKVKILIVDDEVTEAIVQQVQASALKLAPC